MSAHPHLANLIDTFAHLNVIVLGEAMLDRYLEGNTDRLCREAPVPVVTVDHHHDAAGGAANTALNVQSLGSQAFFLSVIGQDPEGERVQQLLRQSGVSTDLLLVHPTRRTLAKHRVMANTQMLLRFDQGTTTAIDRQTEEAVIAQLSRWFPLCDAVLVSDYNYGIVTPRVLQALATLQARSPKILVVDARDLSRYRSLQMTAVKPNYTEATQLLGLPCLSEGADRLQQMLKHGDALLTVSGAEIVAVTLDVAGAVLLKQGRSPYRTQAQPQPPHRATGAGDTFVSALTVALAAQAPLPTVAELAAAAAAIVVAKDGTAICSAEELKGYFSRGEIIPFPAQLSSTLPGHKRIPAVALPPAQRYP